MQQRTNFLPFFIVFFSLSLFLIVLGKFGILNGVASIVNKTVFPLRATTLNIFGLQNSAIKMLSEENAALRKKNSENQSLILENKALKDQFAQSSSTSQSLLPSRVVGAPGFIPGVSLPEYLIINVGSNDSVMPGATVVVGNYLVGKIISSTNDYSKVELINHKNSSFTAKVASTDGRQASGVIKGRGNENLAFENVLLSLSLKKEDIVTTKGDKDERGIGFPPDLIVGKVVSVEKKSSDLFQKAEVVSFVDFTSLSAVFISR